MDKIIPSHMGYDYHIISKGKGTVKLEHCIFFDVLYVPSLASIMSSVYQMEHTRVHKRVNFSPNDVEIIEIASGKLATTSIANDTAKTYEFSKFVADAKPTDILTHGNEVSRICHERFGHLKFK